MTTHQLLDNAARQHITAATDRVANRRALAAVRGGLRPGWGGALRLS
jgi:hypothetical protein